MSDYILVDSTITRNEATIEETDGGMIVRSHLNGWVINQGSKPQPAQTNITLIIDEDKATLVLPGFFEDIAINASGTFSKKEDIHGLKREVTGRVRGQILILHAEKEDSENDVTSLQLTGLLPVFMSQQGV